MDRHVTDDTIQRGALLGGLIVGAPGGRPRHAQVRPADGRTTATVGSSGRCGPIPIPSVILSLRSWLGRPQQLVGVARPSIEGAVTAQILAAQRFDVRPGLCGRRCAGTRGRSPCAPTRFRSPRWCRRAAAAARSVAGCGWWRSRGAARAAGARSPSPHRARGRCFARVPPLASAPPQRGQHMTASASRASASSGRRTTITAAHCVHGASVLPSTHCGTPRTCWGLIACGSRYRSATMSVVLGVLAIRYSSFVQSDLRRYLAKKGIFPGRC